MTDLPAVRFAGLDVAAAETVVVLVEPELSLGAQGKALDKKSGGQLLRAAKAGGFLGKRKTVCEVLGPSGIDQQRVLMVGRGPTALSSSQDFIDLGGQIMGQLQARKVTKATIVAEGSSGSFDANDAADLALGLLLKGYTFDLYKTKRDEGDPSAPKPELTIAVKAPDAAHEQFERRRTTAKTLDELETMLDPLQFYRANRQFLVNVKSVTEVEQYFARKLLLKLNTQTREPVVVSKAKASDFLHWMESR